MRAIITLSAFAHPVHDIRERKAGVDIVDDERAAPTAPITNAGIRADRIARRVESIADAERYADAHDEVAAGCLYVEDPIDGFLRQQIDAAQRAAVGDRGLREGNAACITVAAAGGNFSAAPW